MHNSSIASRLGAGALCVAVCTLGTANAATLANPAHGASHPAPQTASVTVTSSQRTALLEAASKMSARPALSSFTDIHDFVGPEGQNPQGAMVQGISGSLYGDAQYAGANSFGTIFKSGTTAGTTVTAFHSFAGPTSDGATPAGGLRNLVGDVAVSGYLYGVTNAGGANNLGGIFRINSAGSEQLVYSFTGGADGSAPASRLLAFVDGNYYGTTSSGASGYGTVFQFNPKSNAVKTLHAFTGNLDGGAPQAGLSVAIKGFSLNGNLFGVTTTGGTIGAGTIYAISPSGAFATIYNFANSPDASSPVTELIPDDAGNLYGTAQAGGSAGVGVVYETDTNGNEKIVHDFSQDAYGNNPTGAVPLAPLSMNYATGMLYGTASTGGTATTAVPFPLGVVFKLNPTQPSSSNFTVLHQFGGPDGATPESKLIVSFDGDLYGATYDGGANGEGVVYGLPIQ